MKWIKRNKSWIYVDETEKVIDYIVYESGMYQSNQYRDSYATLDAMKNHIENKHSWELVRNQITTQEIFNDSRCSDVMVKFYIAVLIIIGLASIVAIAILVGSH